MTRMRSFEREDLVEVLAEQQHGGAALGGLDQALVHRLHRGHVEPARRRGGDEHLRPSPRARARARASAGCRRRGWPAVGRRPRRLDVVGLDRRSRRRSRIRPSRRNGPSERGGRSAARGSSRSRGSARRPVPSRSSGTKPMPGVERRCGRRRSRAAAPATRDRAARRTGAGPRSPRSARAARCRRRPRRRRSRPARPRTTRRCTAGSAAVAVDPDARRARAPAVGGAARSPAEPGDSDARARPSATRATRASRRRSATVAIAAPGPQHGHAVGDRHHLVQLVRDEDDRPALGRHLAQRDEQRVAPPRA